MKLTELNPRWCIAQTPQTTGVGRHGMGMTFDCPHCRTQRLAVFFENPIDGLDLPLGVKHFWHREGESFDNLSISPSIDAEFVGHWHGFITNGEVH